MSRGNIDISMTSDEQDLLKGQAKVIKQQDEMIGKYKKMLRESKASTKGARAELERFAKATKRINQKPAERYRREVEKLKKALASGLITQETYNRAVARAGAANRAAFGSTALSGLTSYIGGLMSVTAAIGGVSRMLSEVKQTAEELGQKQREDAAGLSELSQLAETPEQMQKMVAEAKKTFAEGGAQSLGEAGRLQFRLESAGVGGLRKEFSDLQSAGTVLDVTTLADAAAALQSALGKEETGGFRNLISKGFGASKGAPASVEQILQGAALAGAQAAALGVSDEQLLAAVSTVAKTSGPERSATQVQSLLKQIEKYGIGGGFLEKGKTLKEQVIAIQSQVSGGTNVRDILGDRQQGITAFRLLSSGMDRFDKNLANVVSAEKSDAFGRKVQIARSAVPEITAARSRRVEENKLELAGGRTAIMNNLANAIESEKLRGYRATSSEGMTTLMKWTHNLDRWMWGDQEYVESSKRTTSPALRRDIETATKALADTAEAMRAASGNLQGATENTDLTNAARANQAAAGGATETH